MATNLPGLGPDDVVPTMNRLLDYGTAGLTTEEYFVLTRVDGRTSFRELVLISGFDEARAISILRKLHTAGAIVLPGEEPRRPPPPQPAAPPLPAGPAPQRPPSHDDRLITPAMGVFVNDLVAGEKVELTEEQKKLIREKHEALRGADLFAVLGVGRDAGRRELKAAYRNLSKIYHPDRYFGRQLGSYKQMLSEIFDLASSAMEILDDPERRELYIASLDAPQPSPPPPLHPKSRDHLGATPPLGTPAVVRRRSVELFEDACAQHLSGDLKEALAGLAKAIAIDPQPRFLRRAAEVALQAQELRLAEEYVKKATELDPTHAAAHRIHAKVLQASGRRPEARAALERARRIDPDNPHMLAELRDLGDDRE